MNSLYYSFLLLVPLALAQPLTRDANQITLQELLAQHGIQNGQMAIVMVAPLNGHQALQAGQFGALPAQLAHRPVLVQSPVQPVDVHYQSQSAPLNIQHTHIPAPKPELQLSRAEEEPHRLVHEIIRPVIQDVREIIQPYRRITQEIRPVQETVVTKIAKDPRHH